MIIRLDLKCTNEYVTLKAVAGTFLYCFIAYFAFEQLVQICFATGRSQAFDLASGNGINISYPYFMIWQTGVAGFVAVFMQIFVITAACSRIKIVNAVVVVVLITSFTITVSAALANDWAKYSVLNFIYELLPYIVPIIIIIVASVVLECKATWISLTVSCLALVFAGFEIFAEANIAYRVRRYELLSVLISSSIVLLLSNFSTKNGKWVLRRSKLPSI